MPTPLTLSMVETLALATLGLLMGEFLTQRISVLERLCLPGPVLGGLILGSGITLLRTQQVPLSFDTSLQTPLMIAFFLAIGWTASLRNLRSGGLMVLKFLVLCSGVLLIQNLVGVWLAKSLGHPPLLGLLAGSVSLTGGPGTALAFAGAFEKAGVSGAGTIGTTCALAGIVLGGLLGAPTAALLMKFRGIKPPGRNEALPHESQPSENRVTLQMRDLPLHFGFFLLVMALGTLFGKFVQARGLTLPVTIGSMVVAAVVRNVHDTHKNHFLSEDWIESMGSIALSYFLVVATMTLELNQLAGIASTLVVILLVQTLLTVLIAATLVFRSSGRDYDAIVMSSGFIGFMLGTTANAMANMNGITSRHGTAPRAYLVVPIVGACFIDFINALVITLSIPWLSSS
ncbi:MAG: hypothetical protein RJB38_1087 [Pseudomonadota bacterium]|jgi:ESS family glutamate:Na+ symporter